VGGPHGHHDEPRRAGLDAPPAIVSGNGVGDRLSDPLCRRFRDAGDLSRHLWALARRVAGQLCKAVQRPGLPEHLVNTALFLLLGVNVKMVLALLLSGFFVHSARWVRWVSFIFILPWAIPSIPTILSFRWMLNAEWGMINNILFKYFQIEGPNWLLEPNLALGAIIVVHIWKYLPFWTLIMVSGRLTISKDLYEAAEVDGANAFQKFIHITFPSVQNLYITSTLLSTIWSLGDFNSIYLLTGGGPADATQVLATLGIRYAFGMSEISTGMATVITALPLMIPLTFVMLRRLRREAAR